MSKYRIFDSWIIAVICNLLAAGVIGVLLRYAYVEEISHFNYRHFLHAHSHVAMLGWIYCAFFILIVRLFDLDPHRYNLLFWLTQISVAGMLVSFILQGYGLFSIAFSTMHILLSYRFAYMVWKDHSGFDKLSSRFLRTSFFFLLLSTLSVWAIGPMMFTSLKGTATYYATVQFFLHFQFNGWFIFALIALALRFFEKHSVSFDHVLVKRSFIVLFISCFLTFALAVTWSNPENILFWLNSIGVVLQLFALVLFVRGIGPTVSQLKKILRPHTFSLWYLSFIGLVIKIVVQTMVAIPDIAKISYTIHNFVIGFIHLIMLACLSLFIFGAFANIRNYTKTSRLANTGIVVFIVGIISTELLLFLQGIFLWLRKGFFTDYYESLVIASALLPAGVMIYLYSVIKTSRYVI